MIEYGPWEGRSWRNKVRVVVERILSPFGLPIEERPELLNREERLRRLAEREREWITKGRSVPKGVMEKAQEEGVDDLGALGVPEASPVMVEALRNWKTEEKEAV